MTCLCVSKQLRLLRRFLMRQDVARVRGSRHIDRDVAFVDMLNDAILIDHERSAIAVAAIFVVDAIVFNDGVFDVAQQRERNADLFGKFRIGIRTIYA